MAKRMLIDSAHPEETRVVVLSGNRLEEFDFETSTKKQIKGNIYLAKVTRVEPSLQAAFVEFGGNRHGFLAFSEIHPDYYRIPIGDRERLKREENESMRRPRPEQNRRRRRTERGGGAQQGDAAAEPGDTSGAVTADGEHHEQPQDHQPDAPSVIDHEPAAGNGEGHPDAAATAADAGPVEDYPGPEADSAVAADTAEVDDAPAPAERAAVAAAPRALESAADVLIADEDISDRHAADESGEHEHEGERAGYSVDHDDTESRDSPDYSAGELESDSVETLGGDETEEVSRHRSRPMRQYKIQEVIKRRQIMLVQVTKEERGNKGAALTTYLSLAGRYCVLMPNTGRGGGVSRKITSATDRKRLKEMLEDLELPEGMGVIVRTAGSERSKAEIKRDYEYLLRLWDEIRELTLRSTAPALIYEEGNLIKRSIRDLYQRDIEEVLVDGEEGYRTAKAFMKMLMPSHAKRVQPYRDPAVPLFHRFQVESQIDAIHSPVVQLKSGGYIVINPTEALVAIDVNSGRSTKERNIEETALRTNLEAADEIARQLRLRDLAGLIVIDFIDMEEHRNQGAVERRVKEAMKNDRARIQIGRISPFGLLELSRQRLRPSLVEASTQPCPHCNGTGHIRSVESTALHVLRAIEDEGIRRRSAEISVAVPTTVALYILNQKRDALAQIEARYGFSVQVTNDDELILPNYRLDRLRALTPAEAALPVPGAASAIPIADDIDDEDDDEEEENAVGSGDAGRRAGDSEDEERGGNADERNRRRRRRRRRRRDERGGGEAGTPAAAAAASGAVAEFRDDDHAEDEGDAETEDDADEATAADTAGMSEEERSAAERRRRRRGRRGGRRRGRREDAAGAEGIVAVEGAELRLAVTAALAPDTDGAVAASAADGDGGPDAPEAVGTTAADSVEIVDPREMPLEVESESGVAVPLDARDESVDPGEVPVADRPVAVEPEPADAVPAAAPRPRRRRRTAAAPAETPAADQVETVEFPAAAEAPATAPGAEEQPVPATDDAPTNVAAAAGGYGGAGTLQPPAVEQPPAGPAHAAPDGAAESEPPSRLAESTAPPAKLITEKPANPKRGWWQRLMS
jgi:ribonuclease E